MATKEVSYAQWFWPEGESSVITTSTSVSRSDMISLSPSTTLCEGSGTTFMSRFVFKLADLSSTFLRCRWNLYTLLYFKLISLRGEGLGESGVGGLVTSLGENGFPYGILLEMYLGDFFPYDGCLFDVMMGLRSYFPVSVESCI